MTDIQFSTHGAFGRIHLNRPGALNSLNLDMIRQIDKALSEVEENTDLIGVIFTGEGKAFCAGGDVKAAYKAGLDFKNGDTKANEALQFFEEEYALNKRIVHFPKDTIVLMDGITMGGGVGLAGPCKYRICTEKTVWAMPETTIGFFPDIGGAWYLAQAGGEIGLYLGLTALAARDPADLLKFGFATHFIPSNDLDLFLKKISETVDYTDFSDLMGEWCTQPVPQIGALQDQIENINAAFSKKSVSDIMQYLEKDNAEWSQEILQLLRQKSPISLLTAFAHIKKAGSESLDETLLRDEKLAGLFMEGDDYYEGVRALLIDKDKNPVWKPYDIEKGLPPEINALFL